MATPPASRTRRAASALVLAVLALALAPAGALAHAQLESSSPARDTVVREQPSAVVLRFDEPVEGNFGAVRVFAANGARVDRGDAFHPGGVGSRLAVHLQPHLAHGTYTATWRVVSADSHVVSSGFTFSIGEQGAAPGASVDQLLSASRTGAVTTATFTVARAVQYAAIALALGALVFWLGIWTSAGVDAGDAASVALARRMRRLVLGAVATGAVSAAVGIVLEGAEGAGISGFDALRPRIVGDVLGTRFGVVWGLGLVAWLLLAGLVARLLAGAVGPDEREESAPRAASIGRTLPAAFLAPPLAFLVLLPALGGHASTQRPVAVMFPANVLHVAAMGTWVGGLAALAACVPAATRALPPERRAALLASVLARFSPLALAAVATILLTGLVQAYVEVRSVHNLVATGFGRDVLAKLLLLLGLVAIGAWHRRRGLPGLRAAAAGAGATGHTGLLVRRALRAEVALVAVVLGVTGALGGSAPSIAAQRGPFNATRIVGPARLELTVDPARPGANAIHLYLFDPRSGAQFTRAKQVTVAASLPSKGIGPLTQDASLAGPGHYTLAALALSPAGTWRMQVTVRVSAFDEYLTTLQVPVP